MRNILLIGLYLLIGCSRAGQLPEPPNIVFILADDLGWMDVSFNGSNFYKTPNIDRLAGEGMFFSDAYSNAPNCAPSRAALMSGQYSPRTGFYTNHLSARGEPSWMAVIPTENHHQLDHEKITLAEALKNNGYKTIHLGKWHLGDTPEYYPEYQGFDVNVAGHKAGKPYTYFSPYGLPNLEDGPDGEYLTDRLTNEAIKFMEENKNDPFFVYMAYYSVHTPLQAPDSLVRKYIDGPHDNGQNDPCYAAMIESLDHNVGRILKSLDEFNLAENTIVVFYSDNGAMPAVAAHEPLRGFKGTLYEGGIRVPLIIKWPGRSAGLTSQVPVIGTDLYPTLLDLAGLPEPDDYTLDGLSLRPILEGKGSLDREALFWHFPAYLQGEYGMKKLWRTTPVGVVRKGDYKLLEFFEDGHLELYDLRNDLGEQFNLADKYPGKAKELFEAMMSWRTGLEVPYPLEKNPVYDPARIPVNPTMGERRGIYIPKIKH